VRSSFNLIGLFFHHSLLSYSQILENLKDFCSASKIPFFGTADFFVLKIECSVLPHFVQPAAGLPDFSWYNIPKREKIYQITIR
jgi:hypothetical protein